MNTLHLLSYLVPNKFSTEAAGRRSGPFMSRSAHRALWGVSALVGLALPVVGASAQVNVLTAHNDIARTGQNQNETILTPANVNPTQFGKLFSQPVNGVLYAQPLYVSQITIPGKGVHNVIYVAPSTGNYMGLDGGTAGEYVYAFDADSNGGIDATPLWQVSLLPAAPAGTYTPNYGVVGTPAIDLPSQTMYLVSSEFQGTTQIHRLHALDITTGAEKFGGPIQIEASVSGTGGGSKGGVLTFNSHFEFQRPGLLLLNGVLYLAFGGIGDVGSWHGWIFSYNPATLQQIAAYCTTPNGIGGGIWMGGAGLSAEVYDPVNKPYGRMFVAAGNGSYSTTFPYANTMSQAMSVLDLDLTGGQFTLEDEFTPFNESVLDGQDADLGAGGPVILPTQTLASGKLLKPILEIGKSGMIYILDRDNNTDGSNNPATEYAPAGLGGYNASGDQVVQELQTPLSPGFNWGAGVWGSEAYWNNTIYSGGINVAGTATYDGSGNSLTAYSFTNGVLSTTPTSQGKELFSYPGPTPAISSNGASNGILWALKTDALDSMGYETLLAYDATDLANTLYSSDINLARDNPGLPGKYNVPTIANGKVFVGASAEVSVYGLLGMTPTAPAPNISPLSGRYALPPTVTIIDAIGGATIYYTTDGSMPTSSSAVYQAPIPTSANETITAIASANGELQSPSASVTYISTSTPAVPVFSLAPGSYIGIQALTITEAMPGTIVYYTIDGPPPTAASAVYTQPLMLSASQTVQAVAIAPGPYSSPIVTAFYTIQPVGAIDFSQGFSLADGPIHFNGSTDLDDFRLQLTNGGQDESGSAFYATPVNIQSFSTNFTFQLSNPVADGMTFTIQNEGATALGSHGGGLGYAAIPQSVAIKFDLYDNAGEGPDSTGLYIDGAMPTVPAIDLTGTGIDLHSGDYINATLTYDGANLTLTLTDTVTTATWSHNFVVDIPAIIGDGTAYVGFTGGTGGGSSSQKVISWTYLPGPPLPGYSTGFAPGSMTLNNGAAFVGTRLRLTDGHPYEGRSAFFTTPVNIQQFTSSFDFQLTDANADGFTFTIQGEGPTALGADGGSLAYGGMPASLAIKFDLYSNAGEGSDSTGLYTDGATPTVPAIDLSSTGIDLHSGDIFNVRMTYNGFTLTVIITDTVTAATATQTYTVNIPGLVRSNSAYAGFTAGSGGHIAIQDILSWSFSPLPVAPATQPAYSAGFAGSRSQLTFNGGAIANGNSLTITDGGKEEARSAFFSTPLNVQQFSTAFNFQLTDATADGFTFTIQGAGPTALGADGSGLGYASIPASMAIKFDLHNNAGEGSDSTGLYTDGAPPTVPATDLSSTGIDLHSGDIFNAQLTYDGVTLTVVITDTATNAAATQTYTVNIPAIVGGSTAYLGFTGGSGGSTAVQNILSWIYSPAS
jgi:hypothetical protein